MKQLMQQLLTQRLAKLLYHEARCISQASTEAQNVLEFVVGNNSYRIHRDADRGYRRILPSNWLPSRETLFGIRIPSRNFRKRPCAICFLIGYSPSQHFRACRRNQSSRADRAESQDRFSEK